MATKESRSHTMFTKGYRKKSTTNSTQIVIEPINDTHRGSIGGYKASSMENLSKDSQDEEETWHYEQTFVSSVIKGIDRNDFQELIDQIPDEKPLTRQELIFLIGSGGATIRNLRATTGALLNFSWEKASQHSDGLLKIGGLRPCRQKAQERINDILKDIQSKVFDSPLPLSVAFQPNLNFLPERANILYKPKFDKSIEVFGMNEEEIDAVIEESIKRLSVPIYVRNQSKYSKISCFLGSFNPARCYTYETISKDIPLYHLPKGTYQSCVFADSCGNQLDVNTQGLMDLAGVLKEGRRQSMDKNLKKNSDNNPIKKIYKSGIWNSTEQLFRHVIQTTIPPILFHNGHPYFYCQLGKVVYEAVPPEVKNNNWNIEESYFHPKLNSLIYHFNPHAKSDVDDISKKLGVKQVATIKYKIQVKHLENRNYVVFTFTFRMDGQPNVISAESPEHYKMQINCMCPDKKYDAAFIIATKESLLDTDTQARFLYSLKLNDCGQLLCEPGSEYQVVSAESIDCNTISYGAYKVSCEQQQILYSADISRMLFYTKSIQPTQGGLLIDFSYGKRQSNIIIHSGAFQAALDKLSYVSDGNFDPIDRLTVQSPEGFIDDKSKENDFMIFSPNHSQDAESSSDRSESIPISVSIPEGMKNLYISNETLRKSVRRKEINSADMDPKSETKFNSQIKLGNTYDSSEMSNTVHNTRQSTLQQLRNVRAIRKDPLHNTRGTTRLLQVGDTEACKNLEKIFDIELEEFLNLVLSII